MNAAASMLRVGSLGRYAFAHGSRNPAVCGMTMMKSSTLGSAADGFFEKQKALNRPLSPHLTIYKPQMTSMLSITHRITGMGMACGVYGIAIGALCMKGQFPECVAALQAMHISQALIIPAKLAASGAFFYHYFNGIRHLAWDLGIGFKLSQLYTSGKIMLVISSIAALYATFML